MNMSRLKQAYKRRVQVLLTLPEGPWRRSSLCQGLVPLAFFSDAALHGVPGSLGSLDELFFLVVLLIVVATLPFLAAVRRKKDNRDKR